MNSRLWVEQMMLNLNLSGHSTVNCFLLVDLQASNRWAVYEHHMVWSTRFWRSSQFECFKALGWSQHQHLCHTGYIYCSQGMSSLNQPLWFATWLWIFVFIRCAESTIHVHGRQRLHFLNVVFNIWYSNFYSFRLLIKQIYFWMIAAAIFSSL